MSERNGPASVTQNAGSSAADDSSSDQNSQLSTSQPPTQPRLSVDSSVTRSGIATPCSASASPEPPTTSQSSRRSALNLRRRPLSAPARQDARPPNDTTSRRRRKSEESQVAEQDDAGVNILAEEMEEDRVVSMSNRPLRGAASPPAIASLTTSVPGPSLQSTDEPSITSTTVARQSAPPRRMRALTAPLGLREHALPLRPPLISFLAPSTVARPSPALTSQTSAWQGLLRAGPSQTSRSSTDSAAAGSPVLPPSAVLQRPPPAAHFSTVAPVVETSVQAIGTVEMPARHLGDNLARLPDILRQQQQPWEPGQQSKQQEVEQEQQGVQQGEEGARAMAGA